MPEGKSDLRQLIGRLATRGEGRTEATVQSDVRMLLLTAPFDLVEENLHVVLEAAAGEGHRIDVEAGFTVIEVKRDLRSGEVRKKAEKQLEGYVRSRHAELQQRYVGILTDGAEWRLYHLAGDELQEVSLHEVVESGSGPEELVVWLEGILATAQSIHPTPLEIDRRLGARSPSLALAVADLASLYDTHRNDPGVKLKRSLWASLLTTAFGTSFKDEDRLFIEHTLLVMMADIIAHAVVGFAPASLEPATLLTGALFEQARISGVISQDFFDWPMEVAGGSELVRAVSRRLSGFDWSSVEHDVMKILYESVITREQRHSLGEYYTPDWIAQRMLAEVVDAPLEQRVLDPACGSGTFLFHAVRRYLEAAESADLGIATSLERLSEMVIGLDVHPVAVAFARVTYLLGIGLGRIQDPTRGPVTVPVYLGDAVQWSQTESLFTAHTFTVPTGDEDQLYSDELRFPEELVGDAGRFDRLVAELAEKAASHKPGTAVPKISSVLKRFQIPEEYWGTLAETFSVLCGLSDQGRDHIWGYYVRNLARPRWLARSANRVDVLIGNPPWVAYRYMTDNMQGSFKKLAKERHLWASAKVVTHQDLSSLFVARTVELYLRDGGRFGFVMPLAVLTRGQFQGFRKGVFGSKTEQVKVSFDEPWSLEGVAEQPFPVPASVIFGRRSSELAAELPTSVCAIQGELSDRNLTWAKASPLLTFAPGTPVLKPGDLPGSPYRERFMQGASFIPRMVFLVDGAPSSPLGVAAGQRQVRSHRSTQEKLPWKTIPSLEGVIESQFVRPVHFGVTIAPFRLLAAQEALVPWDGSNLVGPGSGLDLYPGLEAWWTRGEELWEENRGPKNKMSLLDRLNYWGTLAQQFPVAPHRVIYPASGQLVAARLSDSNAVVDTKAYWAAVASAGEAQYLVAILNSEVVIERASAYMSKGQFGERDVHLHVFEVPIPLFNPDSSAHAQLATLGARAEHVSGSVDLTGVSDPTDARKRIRLSLESDGVSGEIEAAVKALLGY